MTPSQSRLRVWIDTDIGDDPDDAVALALAARHPAVELVGVSTVGDAERRPAIAMELLGALGSAAPVTAGLDELPPVDALLAIGPLSNVAAALRAGVALPARLVAMGGALGEVQHRGRHYWVEYNFASDPPAAAAVVRGCADLVLVPLDVTARLTVDDAASMRLGEVVPTLAPALEHRRRTVGYPLCLHDPFALLVLTGDTDDLGVVTRSAALRVDDDGAMREGRAGISHTVVVDVDERRAVERILRLVGATPEGD
jgi:inosine-uridine nucleoside N-ribohydrolase